MTTIQAGALRAAPAAAVAGVLVADGGDGTLDAALAAGFTKVSMTVEGPTGEPVSASYAMKDGTAVVELADACGLMRVPRGDLQPMTASSYGLGQVLAAALDTSDVQHIVMGVGGSASTDGGAGMLQALGVRVMEESGRGVARGGGPLMDVASIDVHGLHPRLGTVPITLASDVQNPLCGPQGAAAVYGPQKGASPEQVTQLDAALARFVSVVDEALPEVDAHQCAVSAGAGSAGGVGFAAMTVLGATMRPGIELVLEFTGFADLVADADVVITGEGQIDEQSFQGKTPMGVAQAAAAAGVPVIAVCGRRAIAEDELAQLGVQRAYALLDVESDPARCMRHAEPLLEQVASSAVTDFVMAQNGR